MSARTVISVRGLGKRYELGETLSANTARDALASAVRRLFGRTGAGASRASREFWALKDVSFDVAEGEVVGIIGANGAGKSTLLKILSQITEPTTGEVRIRGRVASLLEVGTGFHQELTGRENVFMNGAILGMSQAEIRRKFDEIVDFAGVEAFIDTPVKRYSSGMLVRLGFAVAAHLEPEILVVDEVLAVGDAEFQKKCVGKMQEVAGGGRTVLFVSHNLEAIQRLCSRVVVLCQGTLEADTSAREAVNTHLARLFPLAWSWRRSEAPATGKTACIDSVSLSAPSGQPLTAVTTATAINVVIRCSVLSVDRGLKLAMAVSDETGQFVFSTNPADSATAHPQQHGQYEYVATIPSETLLPRRYSITVSLYSPSGPVDSHPGCVVFDVAPGGTEPVGADLRRPGFVRVPIAWEVTAT